MTCNLIDYLSERSADSWVAIWTFALFIATGVLAWIAFFQIGAARTENRKTETLSACGRYDTDPIIYACQDKLVVIKGYKKRDDAALMQNALKIRHEALTILNFLDAIAIGLKQGLYIEELAREHLINIVRKHVSEFIDSGYLEAVDCPRSSYDSLIALDKRWSPEGASSCLSPFNPTTTASSSSAETPPPSA